MYCSPRTIVLAFEPVENTYNKLLLNISVQKSIVAGNVALGEKKGKQKIRLDPDFSVLNSLNGFVMSRVIYYWYKVSFIYCEVGFNESNTRNTSFEKLSAYLAERGYFFALYQIDSHDWFQGNYLANALYIQKSLFL